MICKTCPTCGRKLTAAKRTTSAITAAIATADMSNKELFAYYKKTAALGDVRFMLAKTLSADLRARFADLERDVVGGLGRVDAYRQYVNLQADWRAESNARDRAAGVPAVGTPEWAQALEDAADAAYYAGLGQVYLTRPAVAA